MSEFNYNESYEFLASRFFDETGYMAPGKSVAPAMAYCENDEKIRRELWGEFMKRRNQEAWILWHEKHGYLKQPDKQRADAASFIDGLPDNGD